MSEEYVNRKDERYYLFEGKTKTGKPKYYCSRKPSASGKPAETMPEGYEWRENPVDGIVSVRKTRPSQIASFEREMLEEGIRQQAGLETFIVDVAEDSLVVYLPDRNPNEVAHVFGKLFGAALDVDAMKNWTVRHMPYSAMLRFMLSNADKRLFAVQRWCSRGSVDDWIFLAWPAPLHTQISKYVPHLGRESFNELD